MFPFLNTAKATPGASRVMAQFLAASGKARERIRAAAGQLGRVDGFRKGSLRIAQNAQIEEAGADEVLDGNLDRVVPVLEATCAQGYHLKPGGIAAVGEHWGVVHGDFDGVVPAGPEDEVAQLFGAV